MSAVSDDSDRPATAPATPPAEGQGCRTGVELAAHIENTPLAVIEWDHECRVARWTGRAEAIFGWSAAEVMGKQLFEWRFVHDDDASKVELMAGDMTALRDRANTHYNRNYTKDGRVIWCEWHNSVLRDAAGRMVSVLSLGMDITARKEAEDALARSEARLRAALSGAQMIWWEWDLDAGRGHLPDGFADFFGFSPDRDYTHVDAAKSVIFPDDFPAVAAAWVAAVRTGDELTVEFRGAAPDAGGRPRWFLIRGQIHLGPGGEPARVVAVTCDITVRKRAEEERAALDRQLLDTQKWESLGVLAGGIAHDFNNILTIVLGNASLARRVAPPGAAIDDFLEQIERASERAADLCRQMLAYSGRGPSPRGRADLNAVIRDAAPLLEVTTARTARVRLDLAPGLPPLRADADQVRQVLLNLVMNAAEAVTKAGVVAVRTAAVTVTAEESPADYIVPPDPGGYVVLEVADNGPGMTADVRARMFDPFFTTKFPGRGLGLAAVVGIVRTHTGAIRVDTAEGKGTTVRIFWRPAESPATPPPARPSPAAVGVGAPASAAKKPAGPGGGHALIVDDEMYVREVVASTVEDLGYTPLVAGDGPSGVELFRAYRATVRVAVIDVVMPGMTGDAVLATIRQQSPGCPAVLMSGFTDHALDGADHRTAFLQKPFHPEDLAAAVARVVAAAAG